MTERNKAVVSVAAHKVKMNGDRSREMNIVIVVKLWSCNEEK